MNSLIGIFNNYLPEHNDAELIKAADFIKNTMRTSNQVLLFNKLLKDLSPAQLWLESKTMAEQSCQYYFYFLWTNRYFLKIYFNYRKVLRLAAAAKLRILVIAAKKFSTKSISNF
jgi:hypothetical protein